MSTKNIIFGGKEADIGIALKDTFIVTNRGEPRNFSVALNDESRCNSDMRFKVVIKPKKFLLEKVLYLFPFIIIFSFIMFHFSFHRMKSKLSLCLSRSSVQQPSQNISRSKLLVHTLTNNK